MPETRRAWRLWTQGPHGKTFAEQVAGPPMMYAESGKVEVVEAGAPVVREAIVERDWALTEMHAAVERREEAIEVCQIAQGEASDASALVESIRRSLSSIAKRAALILARPHDVMVSSEVAEIRAEAVAALAASGDSPEGQGHADRAAFTDEDVEKGARALEKSRLVAVLRNPAARRDAARAVLSAVAGEGTNGD